MKRFLRGGIPPLVTMIPAHTPDDTIEMMKKARDEGAEAYCISAEDFLPEYDAPEVFRRVFAAADGLPIYVTNYRHGKNEGKTDDQIADNLVQLADCGGDLIDVMGDFYDAQPGELTTDERAVEKQMRLIEQIHAHGAQVLMSSHVKQFLPAERVIALMQAQQQRGADIAKVVVDDQTPEEAAENLRLCSALKKELEIPYLFLSGKRNKVLRRVGPMLGVCFWLCRYGNEESKTKVQPILRRMKAIRDNFEFYEEDVV